MRQRVIVIILAILFGLVAAFLVSNYADDVKNAALEKTETVKAYVAVKSTPRGLTIDELIDRKLIELKQIPKEFLAEDTIKESHDLDDEVLAVKLTAGEHLSENKFRAPKDAGLAFTTPKDMVSVAVPISSPKAAGDLIKVGDFVNVVGTANQQDEQEILSKTILQKVRVAAINSSMDNEDSSSEAKETGLSGSATKRPTTNTTISLAMSQADAEKLILMQEEGSVWLTLLPSKDAKTVATDGQTLKTVFE